MNYFQLLKIPQKFNISLVELETNFQKLASQYHPDRAASKSIFEKKQYLQLFTLINKAYNQLKNPIKRAEYFLELNHVDYNPETTFQNNIELLEIQMEFREKIAASTTLSELTLIKQEIQENISRLTHAMAQEISINHWTELISLIQQTKFFEKLLLTLHEKQTILEEE